MFKKLFNALNTDVFSFFKKSTVVDGGRSNEADMMELMRQAEAKNINSEKALSCAPVYCCVNIISKAIASIPLILYRRGKDGSRVPAVDHSLYSILKNEPNFDQGSMDFIQWVLTSMLLTGKACAYISRIGPKIIELVPISPEYVNEVWEGKDHYFEAKVNDKDLKLLPKDVFCVKAMTLDGKNAVNPIRYYAALIGLNLKSVEYNNDFLDNGGRPSGLLTTPSVLKKETAESISAEWQKKYSGGNKGTVAVLHGGFDYKPISMSAADAQLIEIMKFSKSDIAALFGVPAYMLNEGNSSNWGTGISEQRENFVTLTLMPWMIKIQQEIRRTLLNDKEKDLYYAEFNTSAFLRVDTQSRYSAYSTSLGGNNNPGFVSINEVREKENLPLLDDPRANEVFIPNYNAENEVQNNEKQ